MLIFNRLALCFFLLLPIVAQATQETQDDSFTNEQLEFFENKVRPILVDRCHECHSGEKAGGGLNLESRKSILKGGDYGPAIEVGDPEESIIIDAVNYGDFYEMPPKSKLPQDEIDILTKWVTDGAAWPTTDDIAVEVGEKFDLQQRKSDHWSWHPVQRPAIPKVNGDWAVDPIDQFIQQRVNAEGLQVAKKADKATLLRRVCFDLTGLPPTAEQITAFVNKQSLSFEQLVDDLLASPHFGERWARHWMDLVRYAETCGHEFDYPIPQAYQYRDYLIRAFNNDVPYNQFVREHIAGDLITTPRLNHDHQFNESILGTGFWFLGEATHGPVDVKGDEAGRVDNQIDVMTKSFLGLTVACARCHDHKFDAISTKDYYAIAGFLQSSRRQKAMLDFDQEIEKSVVQLSALESQIQTSLQKLASELGQADPEILADYLAAAVTIARTDPKWFAERAILLEGETLKTVRSDSGTVETQEIKPEGDLKWQGDKQTWWRDAQTLGHAWELEFEIEQKGEYLVSLIGTVARDYGAAKVFLDNKRVVDRVDFFGPKLTTKQVELGRHQLEEGKHLLRFELLAPHDEAIPRNMIGIDFIKLQALDEIAGGVKPLSVFEVADERNLDERTLQQLLESLRSPEIKNVVHPLHVLLPLMDGRKELSPATFSAIANRFGQHNEATKTSHENAVKFADFKSPDHGWYRTGFGFVESTTEFSMLGPSTVVAPGVMNSGYLGGNLYGVIRSPTFIISHNNIHIRLRSQNARLRLVIDGFTMDEYNGLLFQGALAKNASHDQFEWRTQSGDIKKYLGHRAHFEVVDHNEGFAAVDQIWFSNSPTPKDLYSDTGIEATVNARTLTDVCQTLSEQTIQILGNKNRETANDRAQLLSWILKDKTQSAFVASDESNVTTRSSGSPPSIVQLAEQVRELRARLLERSAKTPKPKFAQAMADGSGEDEYIFVRGNHKTLGKPAPRQFLEALAGDDARRFNLLPGSGRMELVEQVVAPSNPLTARVMVNRIWHHLTGRGIVASVDNFGVLGEKPSNPELLDYLADEFVQNNWSIKSMIRKIILSSTYQMSSLPNPAAKDIDPDNKLMHRARIRRLQGEAIRDSILSASGELDLRLYGYSVPIHLTPFMQGRGRPGNSGPLDGERRRSVYTEVRRNFLSPMMLAFDTPIPFNTTGRRNLSNVPAQALILMNDPFVIDQAEKWAKRLTNSQKSKTDKIESIYLSAFGRTATESEMASATNFIKRQAETLEVDEQSPVVWQDLCHVIFNVKEFIYIK